MGRPALGIKTFISSYRFYYIDSYINDSYDYDSLFPQLDSLPILHSVAPTFELTLCRLPERVPVLPAGRSNFISALRHRLETDCKHERAAGRAPILLRFEAVHIESS